MKAEKETSTNLPQVLISGQWANNGYSLKKRKIDTFSYTIYFPNKIDIPKFLKEIKFEDLKFKFDKKLNHGIFYPENLHYKDLISNKHQTKHFLGSVSKENGGWAITLLSNDKNKICKLNKYVSKVYENILTKYKHTKNLNYDFLKTKD